MNLKKICLITGTVSFLLVGCNEQNSQQGSTFAPTVRDKGEKQNNVDVLDINNTYEKVNLVNLTTDEAFTISPGSCSKGDNDTFLEKLVPGATSTIKAKSRSGTTKTSGTVIGVIGEVAQGAGGTIFSLITGKSSGSKKASVDGGELGDGACNFEITSQDGVSTTIHFNTKDDALQSVHYLGDFNHKFYYLLPSTKTYVGDSVSLDPLKMVAAAITDQSSANLSERTKMILRGLKIAVRKTSFEFIKNPVYISPTVKLDGDVNTASIIAVSEKLSDLADVVSSNLVDYPVAMSVDTSNLWVAVRSASSDQGIISRCEISSGLPTGDCRKWITVPHSPVDVTNVEDSRLSFLTLEKTAYYSGVVGVAGSNIYPEQSFSSLGIIGDPLSIWFDKSTNNVSVLTRVRTDKGNGNLYNCLLDNSNMSLSDCKIVRYINVSPIAMDKDIVLSQDSLITPMSSYPLSSLGIKGEAKNLSVDQFSMSGYKLKILTTISGGVNLYNCSSHGFGMYPNCFLQKFYASVDFPKDYSEYIKNEDRNLAFIAGDLMLYKDSLINTRP